MLPIYGQIWRQASAIEVPYMAFGLLMAPPVMLACVVASAFALCTGKKFAPPAKSGLAKFETGMMKTSVYAPDSYTSDNQPCKRIGGKNICLQFDRQQ